MRVIRIHNLKYQRFTPLGYKDIGIIKKKLLIRVVRDEGGNAPCKRTPPTH